MITLLEEINSLSFYRDIRKETIFKEFINILENLENNNLNRAKDYYYKLRSKIVNYSFSIRTPKAENSWSNIIINYLTKNNQINQYLETKSNIFFKETLLEDLAIFAHINNYNFNTLIKTLEIDSENIFSSKIFKASSQLAKALDEGNPTSILEALINEIKEEGLGEYKNNKIFQLSLNSEVLKPINNITIKKMDDLIGYNSQKEKLIKNTNSFINGKGGLNTLLYGDLGTGKSTMVKALLDEFKQTPLRFIEVKKSELPKLPLVFEKIEESNYPFIIFIDDLSFNEEDETFKMLKNVLEGSFREIPKNALIYATSNKRNLISQKKSERNDIVNVREAIEEKLSLVSRFGLTISFSVPTQDSYLKIVKSLADKNHIEYDSSLENEAIQWELRHTNRSGRTAEQFIQYYLSQIEA